MRNKHRQRAFKFKLRVDPVPLAGLLWIAASDWTYFRDNPQARNFLRSAYPGEFEDSAIRFVLVRRGQARVPLTIEQTKRLEDPEYFRRVSGE